MAVAADAAATPAPHFMLLMLTDLIKRRRDIHSFFVNSNQKNKKQKKNNPQTILLPTRKPTKNKLPDVIMIE
jgi:hypothetical protein